MVSMFLVKMVARDELSWLDAREELTPFNVPGSGSLADKNDLRIYVQPGDYWQKPKQNKTFVD
jgi:hypothetical protein